jgi:hypothetical protein
MAKADFRLLSKALALGRFTKRELARAAVVKPNTVGSWLARNSLLIEGDGEIPAPSRGRPELIYRIKESAVPEVRERMGQLFPESAQLAAHDLRASGYLYNIDRAQEHVEAWHKLRQATSDETKTRQAWLAARSWIRMSWEDFADLYSAGVTVPFPHLQQLADLERQVGVGDMPPTGPLAPLAKWLVTRLDEMSRRGVTEGFAATVLRARAMARSRTKAAALTAVALAAPIWWDEGLSEIDAIDPSAVNRCESIANLLLPDQIPVELTMVLDLQGPYQHPEQSQAIVLGIARRSNPTSSWIHWLGFLLSSTNWQTELAPAVLYGLGRAGHVNIHAVRGGLDDSLQKALNTTWTDVPWTPSWHAGKIRTAALSYCRRLLEEYRLTDAAALELESQAKATNGLGIPDADKAAAIFGARAVA